MTTPTHASLPLSALRLDGHTQARESINADVVEEYAEAMAAGAVFPPVTVFYDGTNYWLADGFHRVAAAARAGLLQISVDVRAGSRDDAAWFATSANQTHGLRRTTADKRRAVETALRLRPTESDRAIAEHVGVDHKTVASIRRSSTGEIPQLTSRKGRDGRTRALPSAPKERGEETPESPPTSSAEPSMTPPKSVGVADLVQPWLSGIDASLLPAVQAPKPSRFERTRLAILRLSAKRRRQLLDELVALIKDDAAPTIKSQASPIGGAE